MKAIELAAGAVTIDATLIAPGFGLDPALVLDLVHSGQMTAVCEQGAAEDAGRTRVTFFYQGRRLRLTIDQTGRVLERSAARVRRRPQVQSKHESRGERSRS